MRKITYKLQLSERFVSFGSPKLAILPLIIFIVVSLLPQGSFWFESSMSMHMLVQIPLLILFGAIAFKPTAQINARLVRLDPLGAIAFICFTGWMLFWMLPLNLDLATFDPYTRLLKLLSVPIGIGFAFRWLWHRAHTLLKCVVIFEIWASITRLGWLYVESPVQLCSSYLIDEQLQVGNTLLLISGIAAVCIVFYSVFGSFKESTDENNSNSSSIY